MKSAEGKASDNESRISTISWCFKTQYSSSTMVCQVFVKARTEYCELSRCLSESRDGKPVLELLIWSSQLLGIKDVLKILVHAFKSNLVSSEDNVHSSTLAPGLEKVIRVLVSQSSL